MSIPNTHQLKALKKQVSEWISGHQDDMWCNLTMLRMHNQLSTILDESIWPGRIHDNLFVSTKGEIFSVNIEEAVIFKYNINCNAFYPYINLPKCAESLHLVIPPRLQIMKIKPPTKLLVYQKDHSDTAKLHIINTETNKTITIDNTVYAEYVLCINDYIHFIDNYSRHMIATIEDNKIVDIQNRRFLFSNQRVKLRVNGAAIYISSKQCIVLLGGDTCGDENTKQEISVWKYCLMSNIWSAINGISLEISGFGAILTSDERYILLFGGRSTSVDSYKKKDTIWILDLTEFDNWKLGRSKIRCPCKGVCTVTKTDGIKQKDEILVTGYIRNCFQTQIFEHLQMPPVHIINLICNRYTTEMVHYVAKDQRLNNQQFALSMNKILANW